eukprot:PhF_6_TR26120/c0_g1_i2/m.36961
MTARLHCPDNDEHNKEWRRIYQDHPLLGTFNFGKVPLAGCAHKRGPKESIFSRWVQRYFILSPPFLYYFATLDSRAPCKGVVYLQGARIEEVVGAGSSRYVVRIVPRIARKPHITWKLSGPENDFYIRLSSKREQNQWKERLLNASFPKKTQQDTLDSNASDRSLSDDLNETQNVGSAGGKARQDTLGLGEFVGEESNSIATRRAGLYWEDRIVLHNTLSCHAFSTCVECGISPIIGYRFTCLVCPNRSENSLCSWCFYRTQHDSMHLFIAHPK